MSLRETGVPKDPKSPNAAHPGRLITVESMTSSAQPWSSSISTSCTNIAPNWNFAQPTWAFTPGHTIHLFRVPNLRPRRDGQSPDNRHKCDVPSLWCRAECRNDIQHSNASGVCEIVYKAKLMKSRKPRPKQDLNQPCDRHWKSFFRIKTVSLDEIRPNLSTCPSGPLWIIYRSVS